MDNQGPNGNDRPYQCDFDLENNSETPAGKSALYTPYVCAVCGAGAREASNLCAPEHSGGAGRGGR